MQTLDLNKSLEFFNPGTVQDNVHLIGCGAVGSQLAVLLARLGIKKITLWDDDTVASHNLANQNFVQTDIGYPKAVIVGRDIQAINPMCEVKIHQERWTPDKMISGYVFMCVDSIEPRKLMAQMARMWNVKAIFDFRMGLTSGQFYCVSKNHLDNYMLTMNFTDEEADANTPKSACNYTLSVAYSIWALLGYGMSAAVRYWSGEDVNFLTIVDMIGGVTFI